MSDRHVTHLPELRQPRGPFSQGLIVGDMLYLAGRAAFDRDGNLRGPDIEGQARAAFSDLEALCQAAGTSLVHAVRVGLYLSSMEHFAAVNSVMAEFVAEPYPVRTTIPVALVGFDVEVDAVVHIPEGDAR